IVVASKVYVRSTIFDVLIEPAAKLELLMQMTAGITAQTTVPIANAADLSLSTTTNTPPRLGSNHRPRLTNHHVRASEHFTNRTLHLGPNPQRRRLPSDYLRSHHDRGLTARVGPAIKHAPGGVKPDCEHVTLAPWRPDDDFMATVGQFLAHLLVDALLDPKHTGPCVMRIETRGKMAAREAWGFDCFLHTHPEVNEIEEELQGPLVLLVAAGCPKRHERFTVARSDRGGERRARPFAWTERVGMAFVEVEGLHARTERKPQRIHHRRAWNPSATRGNRDHIAGAVGGGDVNRAGTPRSRFDAIAAELCAHPDRVTGPKFHRSVLRIDQRTS